jgi:hypothetical protein
MKRGKGSFVSCAMMTIRPALLVVFLATGLAACGGSSTPPGASKAMGSVAQGGYLFLRWQEGLEIMIWHDLAGEGTADSQGSATGQRYVERGSAHSADGRSLTWEIQTVDGSTGEVQIGGVRYDLAAGTLFIVDTQGGNPAVRQLSRDLSAVPLDHEGVLAFAENDPDLVAFLNASPTATPPGDTPEPLPTDAPATTPTSTVTATPTATSTDTPTPTATRTPRLPTPTATPRPPTATSAPRPAVERILFAPGATQATIDGYLPEGGRARYVMGVAAGQFVEVDAAVGATGPGLRFSIVGADGFVVKPMGPAHVKTVVPSTQDYYLELVSDVGATRYRLSVLIPVRIRFATGTTSVTVNGGLEEGQMRHYVLRALGGQRMIVAPHTSTGQITMVISGADGQVLLSGRVGPPGGVFDGILPTTQDYLISVRAEGGIGAEYSLEITIPAEEPNPDITLVGTVLDVSPSARTIKLAEPVQGFTVVALAAECQVLSLSGHPILLRDLQPGSRIQASGKRGAPGALIADQVSVLANG